MKEFRKNEQGLFICEECVYTIKLKHHLSEHVNKHHDKQKYYEKYLKEENEDLCKICRNKTKRKKGILVGYKNCCCKKCENIYGQQQLEKANIKIYGVPNIFQTKEVKEKEKQTKKDRYGDENYNNQAKKQQTNLERYGDKNYNNREKYKETCLEEYGIENTTQLLKIFEKQQKNAFLAKPFKDTTLYYRGKFELDFLEKNQDKFPDIINAPSINYIFEGKNRVYYPDFFIPSLNLIVEIKSSYYYKKFKDQCDAKEKATIANGFKYIMIIDKDYNNFILYAIWDFFISLLILEE